MKLFFSLLLLLTASITFAQDKLSCSCSREIECKDSILIFLKHYKFADLNTTINNGYETYVCVNDANDSLLFVFYKKYISKGNSKYSLEKIIGNYNTVETVYKKWYGRKADFATIQKDGGDHWQLSKGMLRLRKHQFDNNWQIEFY